RTATAGIQCAKPGRCCCSSSTHGPMATIRRAASSARERQLDRSGRLTKMANTRKLTTEEQAALDAVAAMPDSEIDTSDMPEITDWSGAVRGGLYRPVKRLTSLPLDAERLEWFKRG